MITKFRKPIGRSYVQFLNYKKRVARMRKDDVIEITNPSKPWQPARTRFTFNRDMTIAERDAAHIYEATVRFAQVLRTLVLQHNNLHGSMVRLDVEFSKYGCVASCEDLSTGGTFSLKAPHLVYGDFYPDGFNQELRKISMIQEPVQ